MQTNPELHLKVFSEFLSFIASVLSPCVIFSKFLKISLSVALFPLISPFVLKILETKGDFFLSFWIFTKNSDVLQSQRQADNLLSACPRTSRRLRPNITIYICH